MHCPDDDCCMLSKYWHCVWRFLAMYMVSNVNTTYHDPLQPGRAIVLVAQSVMHVSLE